MTIREMQDEIIRIKKEKDICILAHSYVTHDICEVADFVGDSFMLSKLAKTAPQKTVIMCGVRFMAETCKILSPQKKVILSSPTASCLMAQQMSREYIETVKNEYPQYKVVCYINTTASLKTICDVCVTSSSAVKIVKKLESDKILFIPDCNLGQFVAEQLPEKDIKLLNGCCPIHASATREDVLKAKEMHPEALFLVHPECKKEVTELADYVGSTAGIMDFARNSDAKEFIIGTEISIADHLQYELPSKKFYPLTKNLICADMKINTLCDLYRAVIGEGGEEIVLPDETIEKAYKCIDAMIELGK